MNEIRPDQDAFDVAMRDRYRIAADNLSAATRAQLRQARHAATIGKARERRFPWPLLLGGATAAALAVAFGLGLRQQALPSPDNAPATTAAASYQEPASALDQDPDFYAWLGSADAELVAME